MDPVEEVDVDSYLGYVGDDIVTGYSVLGNGGDGSVAAHGGGSLDVTSLTVSRDSYVDGELLLFIIGLVGIANCCFSLCDCSVGFVRVESRSDLAGYVPAPFIDQFIDQPIDQPLPPSRRFEGILPFRYSAQQSGW